MTILQRISSGWKAYILLALITFTASLPGVFMVPALDRDESRFAQASKQMLETGDYIQIRYQDEGRNKKPAGIHWLQAGAAAVSDKINAGARGQIWAYRLPSLLGAVLATILTFWCGIGLIGRRSAFLGAALFGSGLLLTSEAHIAKTDAVLVCLTVLAMGALARMYSYGRQLAHTKGRGGSESVGVPEGRGMMLLFWGALGASFLIKGPVSLLVAGLALAVLSVAQGEVSLPKRVFNWRGFALFAVLVLPWFIWVQIATEGAFIEGAVGKDLKDKFAGASEGHGGWPGYHLAFAPLMFFPASLAVLPALVLAARTLRGKALDVLASEKAGLLFLMAWFVPTWLFFELLPTKLSHYILPAYPALALICGWGCVQMMGGARVPVSRGVSLALFAVGGLALCFVVSPFGVDLLQAEAAGDFKRAASPEDVLAFWDRETLKAMPLYWLGAAGLALLGALIFTGIRRFGTGLVLAMSASLFLGWHIRLVFLPGAIWLQPTQTARLALADVCVLEDQDDKGCDQRLPLGPPERVQIVGYAEPSAVFTFGTKTTLPPKTVIALPTQDADYPVVYLLNMEDEAGQQAMRQLIALARQAGRAHRPGTKRYALNYSNGDPVAFVAVRIDQ